MMELTPLDVRKKKGDFRRGLRGYEPGVVDDFMDLVADRLENLVRETAALKEEVARLEQQVADYRDREKALTEALVTAQEMREEIRAQSAREVDLLRRQAEQDAEEIRGDAVRAREREEESLNALRRKQLQFLASYRSFLEQELAELAAHARGLEMKAGMAAEVAPPAPPARQSAGAVPAKTRREPERPKPVASAGAAAGIAATAAARPEVEVPARSAPEVAEAPVPVEPEASPVEDEVDAQVGAALEEWGTEFDGIAGDAAPDLILSDADVVVGDAAMQVDKVVEAEPEATSAPEPDMPGSGPDVSAPAPETPEPEAPAYDESAFRADVGAAFGGLDDNGGDLLDLESFDSLQGGQDPALGESIVGPPPVVPPDELTISPVFLKRAEPAVDSEESDGEEETEESPRPDMFSSMFEDDG